MARRTPKVNVESKIAKAEARIIDVKKEFKWLKILVYGKPKKGKTAFGASGPKPVLIVDCNDKGTLSVRDFPDTKVFPMNRWKDIDLIYWYLHSEKGRKYKTVVIDNLTSLQNLCMKFVLGDEASRDPTRDPTMPSQPMYGRVGELMGTQILQFRDLPMHVVFLAQEKSTFVGDDDEIPEVYPNVTPKVRDVLTPAVDIIGRIYVKGVASKKKPVEHRLLIGQHEIYTTGDRSRAGLPNVINLPDQNDNLARLIARIKKGRVERAAKKEAAKTKKGGKKRG